MASRYEPVGGASALEAAVSAFSTQRSSPIRASRCFRWGLDDSYVDAVIENLVATLRGLGISETDIAKVGALANSVRGDVLGREQPKRAIA
jgi:hypothetical protein